MRRRALSSSFSPKKINIEDYLTFTALDDTLTISLSLSTSLYTIDGKDNWKQLDPNTPVQIHRGQTVSFKIDNPRTSMYTRTGTFTITDGTCDVSGNVQSLVAPSTPSDIGYRSAFDRLFENAVNLKSARFLKIPATAIDYQSCKSMFYGCTGLTSAPEIPATAYGNYTYASMFYGCTSLTSAPELPATVLSSNCYDSMFCGCTSLTSAPELPARSAPYYGYYKMFSGCTALKDAAKIHAETIKEAGCRQMFENCTSLINAPEFQATTVEKLGLNSMFYGCSKLINAPALPAATLNQSCYAYMFYNCTALTSAPELPAETLATSCYEEMFRNCSKLTYIKAMFLTTPGTNYTRNWVAGVKSSGTFVKNAAATWDVAGAHGVPSGWTVETATE